ncbi:hypothetical protein [Bifidobacterium cebidarum]|uniref:Adhesin n=1 Tax=Bifidobacterium cebidarum TaxID=2650773 RepID=A0A6I1GQP3_9BIFI|nr:hypothetical protein [Bifidobacterium cebidarum]KAB7788871.1 hypothetical protein F7D08_0605 [Bifidobacterium cebidarum]
MFNDKRIGERVKTMVWAICAIVLATAMLFVCSTPAMAENTAQGITETGDDSSAAQTQSVQGAQLQSDQTQSGNTEQLDQSNKSDASKPADAATPAADPDCANVADWAALKSCVENATDGDVIVIGKTISVPSNDGPIAVSKKVILTARNNVDPAMTNDAAASVGDAFFVIDNGGDLVIGKDAADAAFSYNNGTRWFAYLNKGGVLTVNNGTFSGIDTQNNTGRTQGTLAYNNGGSVIINNGTFSYNAAERGGVIYIAQGNATVNDGTFEHNGTTQSAGVIMQADAAGTVTIH